MFISSGFGRVGTGVGSSLRRSPRLFAIRNAMGVGALLGMRPVSAVLNLLCTSVPASRVLRASSVDWVDQTAEPSTIRESGICRPQCTLTVRNRRERLMTSMAQRIMASTAMSWPAVDAIFALSISGVSVLSSSFLSRAKAGCF